jgi:hypothetical protein
MRFASVLVDQLYSIVQSERERVSRGLFFY